MEDGDVSMKMECSWNRGPETESSIPGHDLPTHPGALSLARTAINEGRNAWPSLIAVPIEKTTHSGFELRSFFGLTRAASNCLEVGKEPYPSTPTSRACIAAAALLPCPMARITVAPPVMTSPPA